MNMSPSTMLNMYSYGSLVQLKEHLPKPGKTVDLKNKYQLKVMLAAFQRLLALRSEINLDDNSG